MSDYDITHMNEWHKVKIKYYLGTAEELPIRRAASERFRQHFVKKHVVMTQLTESDNIKYYYLIFKEKEQALLFKLICGEAVYAE